MIPQHPPPTVLDAKKWSPEFIDFIKFVLVKNPALRPDAAGCLRHPFFKNTPTHDVIVELLKKSEDIVLKRGFRIVDSSSDEESDGSSGSDDDSGDSDGLESGDDGTDPDVDLRNLTIGPDTLIKLEANKKRANHPDSSDEDSDEGPMTMVISNVSDFQSQLEIQKLTQQGVSHGTGATMRSPAAQSGAVQTKNVSATVHPPPATVKPGHSSPAAAAAAAVATAAGKQPPPLPTSAPPSGPPSGGVGPGKPKITVKQAAPRRGVERTIAMTKKNSSASLKKSSFRKPVCLKLKTLIVLVF